MTLSGLAGKLIPPPSDSQLDSVATALLSRVEAVLNSDIRPQVAEIDAVGRYPDAAIRSLKATGLFHAAVPKEFGGGGLGHRFSLEAQLRIACVDSAIAQIFKVHDELIREIFRYCPDFQRERLARLVLEHDAVIGLAVAEAGKTAESPMQTTLTPQADGGFLCEGQKIYTTGAAGADHIATWGVNAILAEPGNPVSGMQLVLIPRGTEGVTIHRDWNVLGQRATDSGAITFKAVRCPPEWIASVPNKAPLAQSSLRYQAGFAAILVGIGLGAITEATDFVRTRSRPWHASGLSNAADDPLVQRQTGELAADLVAAYWSVMATAPLLDAFEHNPADRGALALPISAAKSIAHRASLRACSEIFGLMGTRSVSRQFGLDRWWRNARTLSLHDPVEYKHLELGRHLMTGWEPNPGAYQ
ncbi:MAG: acyl-CoA dehydrogenase family protein [Pseudomonadales bacterium]